MSPLWGPGSPGPLLGYSSQRPRLALGALREGRSYLCALRVKSALLPNPAHTLPSSFSIFQFPFSAFKPSGSKTHPPIPSSHSPPSQPTHAPAPQSISYSPPDSPPKSGSLPAIPSTPADE